MSRPVRDRLLRRDQTVAARPGPIASYTKVSIRKTGNFSQPCRGVFFRADGRMESGLVVSVVRGRGRMRSHCARSARAFQLGVLIAPCVAVACFFGPLWSYAADQPSGRRPVASDKSVENAPAKQGGVEVLFQFADGLREKIPVACRTIAITTAYGKLEIAVEDVRTIELAQRLPEETSRQVRTAIARLESADENDRSAATAELFNLREKSFLALLRASRSNARIWPVARRNWWTTCDRSSRGTS